MDTYKKVNSFLLRQRFVANAFHFQLHQLHFSSSFLRLHTSHFLLCFWRRRGRAQYFIYDSLGGGHGLLGQHEFGAVVILLMPATQKDEICLHMCNSTFSTDAAGR